MNASASLLTSILRRVFQRLAHLAPTATCANCSVRFTTPSNPTIPSEAILPYAHVCGQPRLRWCDRGTYSHQCAQPRHHPSGTRFQNTSAHSDIFPVSACSSYWCKACQGIGPHPDLSPPICPKWMHPEPQQRVWFISRSTA